MSRESAGARLRSLMNQRCTPLPGAYDGMIARAVAQAGFEACYVSGGAVSMLSGVPDIGLATLDAFVRAIHTVSTASGLPALADADTGFGEGEMVVKVVHEYHRAGAAGLHIEDQVFPKRCGHLEGKTLVPIDHMAEKVGRARRAGEMCSGGDFLICARTDARSVNGMEAAIERAKAYVDAGAEMIFPEGLASEDEFASFAQSLTAHGGGPAATGGAYLLANMTEFGKTPIIPLSRFEELGYSCVIYPYPTLRLAMGEAARLLEALRTDGHVGAFLDQMQTRDEMYEMFGYAPGTEWTYPGSTARRD